MNTDAIFKSSDRLSKNNNKITREYIEASNQHTQLTLRKDKIDHLIASKRKIPQIDQLQDESYRIKVKELNLPSEYEINLNKYYENFNLAFLKNYFYSSELNLQKYAVSILLTYISVNGDLSNTRINYVSNQIDSEFMLVLCRFLLIQDKAFQYEACWVIINLVYDEKADEILCNCEDNLKNLLLFCLSTINDSVLFTNALWLIRNITADNIKAKNYFLREKLLEMFPVFLEKYPFNENFKEFMILILNNICTSSCFPDYSSQFIGIIPLLSQKLSHYTPILFLRKCLFCCHKISNISDSIDILINNNVHIKIMETITAMVNKDHTNKAEHEYLHYLDQIEFIKILGLKIIGNMLSDNDVQGQRLINDNIIEFLNEILKENSYNVIMNALWAISNIASGTVCQIIHLYKKNTLFQVINIGIELYKELAICDKKDKKKVYDVFKEVIYIISFCIQGSLDDSLLPWLGYSNCIVLVFLCDGLKFFQENEFLVKNAIKALNKVVRIEKNIDLEMNDEQYINTLISHDIEGNLKRLQNSCNSEISNMADVLYEDLFI